MVCVWFGMAAGLPRLIKGRMRGVVFVTYRKSGPGKLRGVFRRRI
ncbi:hypothetical protein [Streptantibioticus ferralitis]